MKYDNLLDQMQKTLSVWIQANSLLNIQQVHEEIKKKYPLEENDEIAQLFVVSPSIFTENKELEELGVVFSEYLGLYLLPFTFAGTMFENIQPLKVNKKEYEIN